MPIAIMLGVAGGVGLYMVALAYAALVTGASAMHASPRQALFAPAVAVLFSIFIGIHNAWDVVTYLATGKADAQPDGADSGSASKQSKDVTASSPVNG